MTSGPAAEQLRSYLQQTRLLNSISSALYFDQNTVMPAAAASWRGDQLALLAAQSHQRQSCQEYGDLLEAAEAEATGTSQASADAAHQRNLALLRLQLERNRCQDKELVAAL
ncbi:MAG: carboxypeptidase M32, partial [Synechococcus sp.]